MKKLQFNSTLFNMKEAQTKLDNEYNSLSHNECLFFINECEFDVLANNELTLFKVIDNQGSNLGNIEEEIFSSLNNIIDRLSDSYLIDYGFINSID